ncbi:transglycosylase SLT domain-containing protein [Aeromonas jandaei]|uniref:transglycosylase SLT domain-containing protein n=1 Tax=Aeromonas jandaei TaxID=650 RepID=UPI00191DD446|nr:transglycosylase SLT domain-containing protein [Aeromonas jandaei]MBL0612456.1 transglycosylase SLT domain-containing protein [Aeromonas jandaei]MBL0612537.1 transglycosylase SLT domain-containing protein [Aeromonas jandaei]
MKKLFTLMLFLSQNVSAADCFDLAGQAYRIDPDLLRATSFRESSFNPRALNVVSEKKYAVGLMQIHSSNFSHLAQFGITPEGLYRDPCLNIYTGAYYMAHAIKRMGYNWEAVGAYYAGFSASPEQAAKRKWYAQRVKATYEDIKKAPRKGQNNVG